MRSLVKQAFFVIILAALGYQVYDMHRAGSFSLPKLPDGAYTASFANGLRAIVLDADVPYSSRSTAPRYFRQLVFANRKREYLGIPFQVQLWFEDVWSWCKPPTEGDRAKLERSPDELKRMVENARFEAVCNIDVDGNQIGRGLIFSVPRL